MKEIWKEINGYEGKYWISNFGKVKTVKKELKCYKDKHNAYHIDLYKNGKKERFYIHRLVATYFVPNPNKLDAVIHIDKNFDNNKADNLKWIKKQDTYFKQRAIEYDGKKFESIKQFYKFYCNQTDEPKLNYNAFRARLQRGWSEKETLTIPYKLLQCYRSKIKKYNYKGSFKTLKQLYELSEKKIKYGTVCTRLTRNWSAEEAIEIPTQKHKKKGKENE